MKNQTREQQIDKLIATIDQMGKKQTIELQRVVTLQNATPQLKCALATASELFTEAQEKLARLNTSNNMYHTDTSSINFSEIVAEILNGAICDAEKAVTIAQANHEIAFRRVNRNEAQVATASAQSDVCFDDARIASAQLDILYTV